MLLYTHEDLSFIPMACVKKPGVCHAYLNPSTEETETGRVLRLASQPNLGGMFQASERREKKQGRCPLRWRYQLWS